jgi:hypothetical protein
MSYTCIKLDPASRDLVLDKINSLGLLGWKPFGDHSTLHLGPPTEKEQEWIDEDFEVEVRIDGFGISRGVIALSVSEMKVVMKDEIIEPTQRVQHITLRVDVENGWKPQHANDIEVWVDASFPDVLHGKVEYVQD